MYDFNTFLFGRLGILLYLTDAGFLFFRRRLSARLPVFNRPVSDVFLPVKSDNAL